MRLSKKGKSECHKAFLDLREFGPRFPSTGICLNSRTNWEVVGVLSEKWSKFSGDTRFPVPSPWKGGSPQHAYRKFDNLWNKRTEYGRLRWELLDFLIEATKPEDK